MRRFFAVAGALAALSLFAPTPADAGGGCHRSGSSSGDGSNVELAMNCMNPKVLRTASAGPITFVNRDEITHNLFGDGWSVDELRAGKSFTREFVAGTHLYSCTLHPGMLGVIVVGDGVGGATPVADVTPVRAAASTSADSDPDRLPLGLALGAVLGVAATLGALRVRRLGLGG